MAEWLRPRTPDLGVWGSSLARRVVSLDEELYCPSHPGVQVGTGGILLGANPAMD